MSAKPRNRASLDAEAVARMMAAQDGEEIATLPPQAVEHRPAASAKPNAPAFDPGKVDGRTLRRTGREPFATRIRPETHEALKRIAYAQRITIAEALEQAVAAYKKD